MKNIVSVDLMSLLTSSCRQHRLRRLAVMALEEGKISCMSMHSATWRCKWGRQARCFTRVNNSFSRNTYRVKKESSNVVGSAVKCWVKIIGITSRLILQSARGPGNVGTWDWQHVTSADSCKRYAPVQVLYDPYGSHSTSKHSLCSWLHHISIVVVRALETYLSHGF